MRLALTCMALVLFAATTSSAADEPSKNEPPPKKEPPPKTVCDDGQYDQEKTYRYADALGRQHNAYVKPECRVDF